MEELQAAEEGSGALLERDYWAVLREPRVGPVELAGLLARHFEDFGPPALVTFRRRSRGEGEAAEEGEAPARGEGEAGGQGEAEALEEGDELDVDIRAAGTFGVRVMHRDDNSLTLGTLEGHPEAGRITFGAYPNGRGDVVFHIRSRARAGSRLQLGGFLFAGDPMQTNTWSDFINRLAVSVGEGVMGAVHAEKRSVSEEPGDRSMDGPTFRAKGE